MRGFEGLRGALLLSELTSILFSLVVTLSLTTVDHRLYGTWRVLLAVGVVAVVAGVATAC